MHYRRSGFEEDLLDAVSDHRPSLAPRHTKHISMLCLLLLMLMILGIYLVSAINNPQSAPGSDQVAPGRAIGQ